MRIGPIPKINKEFSLHTREWERTARLGLEHVYIEAIICFHKLIIDTVIGFSVFDQSEGSPGVKWKFTYMRWVLIKFWHSLQYHCIFVSSTYAIIIKYWLTYDMFIISVSKIVTTFKFEIFHWFLWKESCFVLIW